MVESDGDKRRLVDWVAPGSKSCIVHPSDLFAEAAEVVLGSTERYGYQGALTVELEDCPGPEWPTALKRPLSVLMNIHPSEGKKAELWNDRLDDGSIRVELGLCEVQERVLVRPGQSDSGSEMEGQKKKKPLFL